MSRVQFTDAVNPDRAEGSPRKQRIEKDPSTPSLPAPPRLRPLKSYRVVDPSRTLRADGHIVSDATCPKNPVAAQPEADVESLKNRGEAYNSMAVVATLLAGFALSILSAMSTPETNSAHVAIVCLVMVVCLNLYAMIVLTYLLYTARRLSHLAGAKDELIAGMSYIQAERFMALTFGFRNFAVHAILTSVPIFIVSVLLFVCDRFGFGTSSLVAAACCVITFMSCINFFIKHDAALLKSAEHDNAELGIEHHKPVNEMATPQLRVAHSMTQQPLVTRSYKKKTSLSLVLPPN